MRQDQDIFHDAHDLHFNADPSKPLTNNYQRSLDLNRLPVPTRQGNGLIVVGMGVRPNGQLEYCF